MVLGGSYASPVSVYTFDADPSLLASDGYIPVGIDALALLDHDEDDDEGMLSFDHPDVARMHNVDAAFMDVFRFGYRHFREGSWEKAKVALERAAGMRRGSAARDGAPSAGSPAARARGAAALRPDASSPEQGRARPSSRS